MVLEYLPYNPQNGPVLLVNIPAPWSVWDRKSHHFYAIYASVGETQNSAAHWLWWMSPADRSFFAMQKKIQSRQPLKVIIYS